MVFGQYQAVISFLGYNPMGQAPINIYSNSQSADLGAIGLALNVTALDEVTVTGQASTTSRKIEKQVYNADQFVTARGGTTIDLLKNIPSVSISPDGEVSLRGTSGFLVYLDGKPTQLDASIVLSQLSANNIDKLEIITVPTARFDSQGKGGIINILTNRGKTKGTSLTGGT